MKAKALAEKYINKTDLILDKIGKIEESTFYKSDCARGVFDESKRYLSDAKYYLKRGEYELSLASVSYSEGLLDSLRLLGYLEFSW